MLQEKIQVSARIPKPLYDKCNQSYENMTTAVIAGLELLIQQNETRCNAKETRCNTNETKAKTKNETNAIVHETICNTNETDHIIRELKTKVEEKEALVVVLKGELEKAHQDKDNIQNIYDNYMRQMQTLIQQKAIEAPGEKKKWWVFWK